jgi:peptide deformylase
MLTGKEMQKLIRDMKLTMIKKDGVGLAAPQVGKNIRMIIINLPDEPLCLINPVITKKSWAKETAEEGCLSLPGIFDQVSRHKKVCCHYISEWNEKKLIEAEDLMARVLQHEIDHLDGILFIDRVKTKK